MRFFVPPFTRLLTHSSVHQSIHRSIRPPGYSTHPSFLAFFLALREKLVKYWPVLRAKLSNRGVFIYIYIFFTLVVAVSLFFRSSSTAMHCRVCSIWRPALKKASRRRRAGPSRTSPLATGHKYRSGSRGGIMYLTSLPLVSGNTYLTSLPLVSVRHHGHVTWRKSRLNFLSSAGSVPRVQNL